MGILFLFALLMVAAAYSMIRKGKPAAASSPAHTAASSTAAPLNYPMVLLEVSWWAPAPASWGRAVVS